MFLLSSGYGHCHCHCTVTLYPGAAPAAGQTRPKNYIAISYFRHFLLSVVEAVDHAVNAETPRIFISISYFRVDLTLGRPPVVVQKNLGILSALAASPDFYSNIHHVTVTADTN